MSQRLLDGKTTLRAIVAAGSVAAFLFAVVLSAFPQLHEQIHAATGAPNHECAVTLVASGNYQHTPTISILVAPPMPPSAFVHAFASFQFVGPRLEFSLLEHAPPSVS